MTTALALYSGGLDSTLACRVIMEQGIRVVAVKFVTPFFGAELLADPDAYREKVRRKYGIEVVLRDLSEPYLKMLAAPAHGYGKNFNPCVDCKIMLMGEARRILPELGASFLVSGEVLGQRPMSQRRDTLRVIERDSGCADLLLRPLCALNLPPTKPEREGLVDRQRLYAFRGRNRTPQIELAASFGITDYQSPGGGCVLTDPNLAQRIRGIYDEAGRENRTPTAEDLLLLLAGRVFRLPGGAWLVLGRHEVGNDRLQSLRLAGDWQLLLRDHPGPLAILRRPARKTGGVGETEGVVEAERAGGVGEAVEVEEAAAEARDLQTAAALVLRYSSKKIREAGRAAVLVEGPQDRKLTLETEPLADEIFSSWRR